jgi:murein DD-endopeptidase MepM/ murein hydrolase activator NlpD
VGRPTSSTKRMSSAEASAEASTSAAAAADDVQEEGNQTNDDGDNDTVDKGTVDKDTVEAALREKRAPVARVRQWFEGEPEEKELICIACPHTHKIHPIESVAVFHPGVSL